MLIILKVTAATSCMGVSGASKNEPVIFTLDGFAYCGLIVVVAHFAKCVFEVCCFRGPTCSGRGHNL